MNLIPRPKYLAELIKWQPHQDLVKIVTGVRRCGKSKLFEIFQNHLKDTGVSPSQIISLNLEDPDVVEAVGLTVDSNDMLVEWEVLYNFIKDKMSPDKKNYIFIDEVQRLKNWHHVANGLRLRENTDVYLTGSNAYMFSSDLSNMFGGRFVEIKMQPLSFAEYASSTKNPRPRFHIENQLRMYKPDEKFIFSEKKGSDQLYQDYTKNSGFPQTLSFDEDEDKIKTYLLDSVYKNTVQKDVVARFGISNPIRLYEITKFIFDNISNPTSVNGIARTLKSNGINISTTTLNNYIQGLLDSYLVYKCDPFDIKGKRILASESKYYACDIGLRDAIIGRTGKDAGRALENIVYLELLRRGYSVATGRVSAQTGKTTEVDFVATKAGGVVEYYQVAWNVLTDNTEILERELRSLFAIKDNYPKFLITMDIGSDNNNGIQRINAVDWLLN